MSRRRGGNDSTGSCAIFLFIFGIIGSIVGAVANFIAENSAILITGAIIAFIIYIVKKLNDEKKQKELLDEQRLYEEAQNKWNEKQRMIGEQRRKLLKEILSELQLENFNLLLKIYDDQVILQSMPLFDNYSACVYLGKTNAFETIKETLSEKRRIVDVLKAFLKENDYKTKPQYDYVEKKLIDHINKPISYKVKVIYKTSAGIKRDIKDLIITESQFELLNEISSEIPLENLDLLIKEYDDQIIVKSLQSLDNYSDLKYLSGTNALNNTRAALVRKREIADSLNSFLKEKSYKTKLQYDYVKEQLVKYVNKPINYKVKVVYITPAGNERGTKELVITESRITEVIEHPELIMTKGEYSTLLKKQAKEELDAKRHSYYTRVNEIITIANYSKESMVVKSAIKTIDDQEKELFEKTIPLIQKIKTIDSDEWWLLDSFIATKDEKIRKIVRDDKQISDYYASEAFALIKRTCSLLTESQKEFNEYIEEKAESITKLFGTRVVRNETQNEYVYNYVRAYKKSVTPFTAEVSDFVFGSAERDPIEYIIKCFYPNKSLYKEQIQNLKILMEELETLNEAKVIIDNYKKDYDEYIHNVPEFIMERDEDGFYSRLGLTIIDEAVLNVEYRFAYTSNGGLVQRSFTVPMNEETITELINRLESKLSLEALTKEQRALVTSKLRAYIKERDNYTCCYCGNSVYDEPNLLLEIDHIIPISKGGLTTEDNLQTLCWKCNRRKGAKMLPVFS